MVIVAIILKPWGFSLLYECDGNFELYHTCSAMPTRYMSKVPALKTQSTNLVYNIQLINYFVTKLWKKKKTIRDFREKSVEHLL